MRNTMIYRWAYPALLLLLYLAPAAAQNNAPGWSDPEPSDFASSMNVTAQVYFNGEATATLLDTVAYFIGGELRGLADPLNVPGLTDGTYHLATVFGNNDQGAPVEIRVYHAATDSVYVIDQSLTFDNQGTVGGFEAPYEIRLTDGPGGVGTGTIMFADLPDQTTLQGVAFDPLDLSPFVVSASSGAVTFGLMNAQPGVTFSIDGNNLVAVADADFTGRATVDVTAMEDANGDSDVSTIAYTVEPAFVGPTWLGVPDQVADEGEDFNPLDLASFVDMGQSTAQVYAFEPVLPPAPVDARPDLVNPINFATAMTLIARAQYTDGLRFADGQDQLAAYVNGELRAVSGPALVNGENLFFLNIGTDGSAGEEYTLRFYSAAEQRIFDWPLSGDVVGGGQSGTVLDPTVVDLSPVSLSLDSSTGQATASRLAPNVSGVLTVDFTVADAAFPDATGATDQVVFTALGQSLPVDLLAFSGQPYKDGRIELKWTSENEVDLSHYAIERSTDQRTFWEIARVEADLGEPQPSYQYLDGAPEPGRNYYRLRMEDLDGTFVYSPMVDVNIDGRASWIMAYPNPAPAGGSLFFKDLEPGAQVTITDAAGRLAFSKPIGPTGGVTLDDLPNGLYNYRIRTANQKYTVGKFVIR